MPLVESEAIILRSSAFGEADKLVSFFCRQYGRMRGVAPAARKSRKRFGAALEPLTYVRVWFYEKESRELARLEQCEILESFWDAAPEYERTVALSHIAELCELLLPEREQHEHNFRLTLMTLRCLRSGMGIAPALTYFQLWSARLAGWLPRLDICSRCGKSLDRGRPAYVSPSRGHIYCGACRAGGTRALSPEARASAGLMLGQPLDTMPETPGAEANLNELRSFLLDLIEHHGDRKLSTREMLYATH